MANINVSHLKYKNYSKYTDYTKSVLEKDSMAWDFECSLFRLRDDQIALLYEDLSEKKKNEDLSDTETSILNYCVSSIFDEPYDPDEEDRRNYYHSRDEYMYDDDDDDDNWEDDDDDWDSDEEEEYDDE